MTAQLVSFPTTTGLFEDVDEAAYHADRTALSSTSSRLLSNRTPAHFQYQREHGQQHRTAFDLGSAFHLDVLGKGADLVVIDADDYRSKTAREERDAAREAGKTPLLRDQAEQVERMAAAVRAHPVAGKLFARTDCRPEVTFVGRDPETGVLCKARTDWLLPVVDGQPIRFVDLKSGEDASPAGMAKSMTNFSYGQQFDFYGDVIRWALELPDDYPVIGTLVFCEKEPPHLVGIGQPDEETLAWAHEDNRRARHTYARCTETGQWPGHDDAVVPLSLPGWRKHQYELAYGRPGDDTDEGPAGAAGVFDPDIYFAEDFF